MSIVPPNRQGAIEDPKSLSINPPSYREFVEIAIRNNLRARQIVRCQRGVEEVSRRCRDWLKIVFQEGKNTDMNAIKHAPQPRIQSTF